VEREPDATADERVGLCAGCRHARRVEAPRTLYWMCRLSLTDPRYDKYPRLPVVVCAGYEKRVEDAAR
jgi:hypothetical protein